MRYILVYSIDEFKEYKIFNEPTLMEMFINEKNEYNNNFSIHCCYEIGKEIFIEPVDFITKYCIIEEQYLYLNKKDMFDIVPEEETIEYLLQQLLR